MKIRQSANNITDGRVAPDLCLTDYNTWALVEQILQAFQRNTYSDFRKMDAGAGFLSNALIWDGLVINKDKKVTQGNFFLLNTKFLEFRGLNWFKGKAIELKDEAIKGNIYSYTNPAEASKGFTWTGFIDAFNQGAVNGFVILGGQLVCTNPSRQALISGVTGN